MFAHWSTGSLGRKHVFNGRTAFDRTNDGSLVNQMQGNLGDAAVIGEQGFHHAPLPRAKDLHRKALEVAEEPDEIQSLEKRGGNETRAQRGADPEQSAGEFIHPHDRAYL